MLLSISNSVRFLGSAPTAPQQNQPMGSPRICLISFSPGLSRRARRTISTKRELQSRCRLTLSKKCENPVLLFGPKTSRSRFFDPNTAQIELLRSPKCADRGCSTPKVQKPWFLDLESAKILVDLYGRQHLLHASQQSPSKIPLWVPSGLCVLFVVLPDCCFGFLLF